MDGDVFVVEDHDLEQPGTSVGADVEQLVALVDHPDCVSHCMLDVFTSDAMAVGTVSDVYVRQSTLTYVL